MWEETEKIGQRYEWLGKLRRFLSYGTRFISSSFLLLLFFHFSQLLHQRRRRWSFCTSLQMSPESGPESSPYRCLGQILRLLSTQKKRNIPDLVVIRIVRPHGQLQGVFATHHSFFFITRYVTRPVLRPRLVSNTRRHPPAIFLVTLKTTFDNNVETKESKSCVVLAVYRGSLGNRQSIMPTRCLLSILFIIIHYINIYWRLTKLLYRNYFIIRISKCS